MAKKLFQKEACVECPTTHTLTFDADNKKKILRIQGEYLLKGQRRSIEQIVNQLVKNCDR